MERKFILIFLFLSAAVTGAYSLNIERQVFPDPPDSVTFILPNVEGPRYTEVLVPVTVAGFDNVDSFFFNISWDGGVLTYLGAKNMLEGGLTIADYEALNGSSSDVELFFQDNLVSLADGTIIFWLRFYLNGPAESVSPLTISDLTVQINNYQNTDLKKSIDGSVQINGQLPITFIIGNAQAPQYSDVYVPVTVQNFNVVNSFLFQVQFDPEVMYFVQFDPLYPDFFGGQYNGVPSNQVEVFFQGDMTLPDNTVIAYIVFHTKGANGTLTPLSIVGNDYVYFNGWDNLQLADNAIEIDGSVLIDSVAPKGKGGRVGDKKPFIEKAASSIENVKPIEVYPNPCQLNTRLSVWSGNEQQSEVTITNTQGKTAAQLSLPLKKGLNELSIDTSHLPSGIYILKVRWANRFETIKFSKD